MSVPFCWGIHAHPSDYWRFTPYGVQVLFPEIQFDLDAGNVSTWRIGETAPINDRMFMLRFLPKEEIMDLSKLKIYAETNIEIEMQKAARTEIEKGLYVRRVYHRVLLRLLQKIGVAPSWVIDYPWFFPPVQINMIGKKRVPGSA